MASSQSSTTSSGYFSQANGSINTHYACYWDDSCNGDHELDKCSYATSELRGKLGLYYSPNGIFKRFSCDMLSSVNLTNNPTGCTNVHLLIYTRRPNGEIEVLFVLAPRITKGDQFLLTLPSGKPRKRGEHPKSVPARILQWITRNKNFIPENGFKNRFLFQHSYVIYPLYLTHEEAKMITDNFIPDEEFLSLHWFPLSTVREQLPPWPNYLKSKATEKELAQHKFFRVIDAELDGHHLCFKTILCLLCIREHIEGGFETFLK